MEEGEKACTIPFTLVRFNVWMLDYTALSHRPVCLWLPLDLNDLKR